MGIGSVTGENLFLNDRKQGRRNFLRVEGEIMKFGSQKLELRETFSISREIFGYFLETLAILSIWSRIVIGWLEYSSSLESAIEVWFLHPYAPVKKNGMQ